MDTENKEKKTKSTTAKKSTATKKSTTAKKSTTTKKSTTVAAKKKTTVKKVDNVKDSIDKKVKKEVGVKEEAPKKETVKVETVNVSNTNVVKETKKNDDTFDKNLIIAFIIGALITLIIVYAFKINTPAKLTNGEEIIVSYKDQNYTADDYYKDLKDLTGIETLIDKIDKKLFELNGEYTDKIIENVQNQVQSYKAQFGENFTGFINQYGFKSEEEFYNYFLYASVKQSIIEKYVFDTITEEEINTYYKENVKGDLEASHILIQPVTTENMTEEEIAAANADALALANEVINKLNNGEDFATLAKTYSNDTGSAANGGKLQKFNSYLSFDDNGNEVMFVKEFTDATYALEVGKYSTTPVKSEYGYHIILKHSETEIPKQEDVTDVIKKVLYNEKISTDSSISYKALDSYRKDNGLEFKDEVLKKQYESYLEKSLN